MFSSGIVILENIVHGGDVLTNSSNAKFYIDSYENLSKNLVEGELITCYFLGKRFALAFRQSPPYVLTSEQSPRSTSCRTSEDFITPNLSTEVSSESLVTELDKLANDTHSETQLKRTESDIKDDDEDGPLVFKASNYGMVIYQNLDPAQSEIHIDTQSLYYCTKLVIVDQQMVVDIHFPIDEVTLNLITDTDIDDMIHLFITEYRLNLKDAKWYTISGNDRNNNQASDQEPNVSQCFVARLRSRLEKDPLFPKDAFTQIDMQVKVDYRVNFAELSIEPVNLKFSPKPVPKEGEVLSSSEDEIPGLDEWEKSDNENSNNDNVNNTSYDNNNNNNNNNNKSTNQQSSQTSLANDRSSENNQQSTATSLNTSSEHFSRLFTLNTSLQWRSLRAAEPSQDEVQNQPTQGTEPRSPRNEPGTPRQTKRRQF